MFVDRVRIWARGGKGGNGCCSFRREAYVPLGGPDGGDGGKGGDVWIKVNPHRNNLTHLRYKPHHFAANGTHGKGSQRTGRQGKNLTIEVPPGTVISRLPSPEGDIQRSVPFEHGEVIADLRAETDTFLLARGGRGGFGNLHFKTQHHTAPRECEPGQEGDYGQFALELKSIADVGLVGFPNAGKSSLLRALSAAQPKVASYPFTTLTPVIGVVENKNGERFSMADIPGLIEGASEGVGLGHDFLRHIERCSLLVFVLDVSGFEGRDPISDFGLLRKEIKEYDAALAERPYCILGNKIDIAESQQGLERFRSQSRKEIVGVSAETGAGIEDLKTLLFQRMEKEKSTPPEVFS